MEKIPFNQWTTLKERYEIGNQYRERFHSLIESAKMVQEHPFVHSFSFIRGQDLMALTRIPHFQDYRDRLCTFDQSTEKFFISYRWLSSDHPDPDGRQLRLLQRHVKPDAYYWIDYACLPQSPRDVADEALFNESLSRLTTLLFETKMLVLRHRSDSYMERAWCFLELLAGHTVVKDHLQYAFEDERDADFITGEARSVVQQAVMGGLPDHLKVTNPADLPAIRTLTDTTRAFFELNTLMHYMSLGRHVSDNEVYAFGEDPYFLFATHDLSDLLLWVFDKARELDLPISLLARNEDSDNYFVELARRESFTHTVDPRRFPKKVTRDQGGMTWFMICKDKPRDLLLASAHNLFFLLTSLIK
ncbi:MAG: hypothetical protein P8171_18610 [Candidatus Thiodiazotropha sp.]